MFFIYGIPYSIYTIYIYIYIYYFKVVYEQLLYIIYTYIYTTLRRNCIAITSLLVTYETSDDRRVMESLNIGNKTSDDIEAGPERNKPARVVRKGVFAQVKTVEKVRQPRDDIYTICKNLLPACSYTYTTPKILEPLKDRVDDYFECIRSGSSVETEVIHIN